MLRHIRIAFIKMPLNKKQISETGSNKHPQQWTM